MLSPGTRIGAYEILALIGAGGMGEVYRARDTRLGRDVALKVLPELFAANPDRLTRFKREAQVLASLNHPNIAAIHGCEDTAARNALVLELVEGPTLADRIAQGPIPLDEALPIARQIAEALETAHDVGIIHRDLKPANIKVRPDGTVKVLDFGLAKLAETPAAVANANVTASPTITSPAMMTGIGVLLGTAAYMAPEQARGKSVDKRADIWAFGCVLYEMLTAKRAFAGDEVTDTLAYIITKDPDWNALPAATPPDICKLLRRCLQKDRHRRLPDIGVARLDIADTLTMPLANLVPRAHGNRFTWIGRGAVIVIVLLLGALALALTRWGEPDAVPPMIRFSFSPPYGWTFGLQPNMTGGLSALAVSRDGRQIAFVARTESDRTQLWVRSLDTMTSRPLEGTEGATSPFWSPDGRFLAFFSNSKLKKVAVAGGPAVTLSDAPDERGGTWNQDGVILFVPAFGGAIHRVADAGGIPMPLPLEGSHARPMFLPDGRYFVYRATGGMGSIRPVYMTSLDSLQPTKLMDSDTGDFYYSRGHLLFLRETTLMAQALDVDRRSLTGDAFPIAEDVHTQGNLNLFAASESGVVVYQEGIRNAATQMTWFDRTGKRLSTLAPSALHIDLRLSPDGGRVATSVLDLERRTQDIWIVDVVRGVPARLTFDEAIHLRPVWSPDGKYVVYTSRVGSRRRLMLKSATGAGSEQTLIDAEMDLSAHSFSPDGKFLLYAQNLPGQPTGTDLWVVELSNPRNANALVKGPGLDRFATFSPDGRWIAYDSNESSRYEVYVVPFPTRAGKWQVSTSGGAIPRWRSDGREIYYLTPDNRLMAVEVRPGTTDFQVGAVTPLAQTDAAPGGVSFDVSRDGQRFLVNSVVQRQTSDPINVVVNWSSMVAE